MVRLGTSEGRCCWRGGLIYEVISICLGRGEKALSVKKEMDGMGRKTGPYRYVAHRIIIIITDSAISSVLCVFESTGIESASPGFALFDGLDTPAVVGRYSSFLGVIPIIILPTRGVRQPGCVYCEYSLLASEYRWFKLRSSVLVIVFFNESSEFVAKLQTSTMRVARPPVLGMKVQTLNSVWRKVRRFPKFSSAYLGTECQSMFRQP